MSNGTKKLGKDFRIEKNPDKPHRSVTVIFDGENLRVGYQNSNWQMAVDMLIDGLRIARVEEKKTNQEKEPSRIVVPPMGAIPPRRA